MNINNPDTADNSLHPLSVLAQRGLLTEDAIRDAMAYDEVVPWQAYGNGGIEASRNYPDTGKWVLSNPTAFATMKGDHNAILKHLLNHDRWGKNLCGYVADSHPGVFNVIKDEKQRRDLAQTVIHNYDYQGLLFRWWETWSQVFGEETCANLLKFAIHDKGVHAKVLEQMHSRSHYWSDVQSVEVLLDLVNWAAYYEPSLVYSLRGRIAFFLAAKKYGYDRDETREDADRRGYSKDRPLGRINRYDDELLKLGFPLIQKTIDEAKVKMIRDGGVYLLSSEDLRAMSVDAQAEAWLQVKDLTGKDVLEQYIKALEKKPSLTLASRMVEKLHRLALAGNTQLFKRVVETVGTTNHPLVRVIGGALHAFGWEVHIVTERPGPRGLEQQVECLARDGRKLVVKPNTSYRGAPTGLTTGEQVFVYVWAHNPFVDQDNRLVQNGNCYPINRLDAAIWSS